MWRYSLLVALGLGVVGCGSSMGGPGAGGPEVGGPDAALDVYEAAIRHKLQKHPREAVAYLAVDQKDAPAELLDRLRKVWPNLKLLSAVPKDNGLRIYVDELKWTGRGTAEVKAGTWFPTKFAGEGHYATFHLVYRDGRWVVDRISDEVMS